MASLKKFNGTTWNDSKVRKLGTSTDTITTLPAVVYADGTNATVGLKGNMQQTGTPSPDNPIQPSETGERTGNLFDYTKTDDIILNKYINQSGAIVADNEYYISYPIKVNVGETYTWRFDSNSTALGHTAPTVGFYDNSDNLLSTAQHNATVKYFSFEVPTNCAYIRASVFTRSNAQKEAMLNAGSAPLPYENFGYKIPISSASTTTPVYLGEVETTRRIKKLVLTGEEDWKILSSSFAYLDTITDYSKVNGNISICTHFRTNSSVTSAGDAIDGVTFYNAPAENYRLYIKDSTLFTTITTLKSYLAAQYAAGTPVCVWYVLATAETAIVNEPIRKIGNYADTVSDISIPTITGADSFDVETTLKPSEVELTYTGWHNTSVKEKSENFAYDILVQDLQPVYSIVLLFSADLEPDTTYTLSFDSISGFYFYINEQVFNVKYINTVTGRNQVICTTKSTLDKSDNRQYLNGRWIILKNAMSQPTNIDITNVMLNSDSTALPYEPYWK